MRSPAEVLSEIKPGQRLKTVRDLNVSFAFRATTYRKNGGSRYDSAIYARLEKTEELHMWDCNGRFIKRTDQDLDGLDIDPSSAIPDLKTKIVNLFTIFSSKKNS